MDIEATLENLRNALADVRLALEYSNAEELVEYAGALSDSFEALDEWISKGGHLPADWQRNAEYAVAMNGKILPGRGFNLEQLENFVRSGSPRQTFQIVRLMPTPEPQARSRTN